MQPSSSISSNLVVGRAVFNAHLAFHPYGNAFGPAMATPMMHAETIEEVAKGVVHPVTKETITKYQKLVDNPILCDSWEMAMCVELGQLTQGFGETKGTEIMRFLALDKIKNIAKDQTVTYAIIVDSRRKTPVVSTSQLEETLLNIPMN